MASVSQKGREKKVTVKARVQAQETGEGVQGGEAGKITSYGRIRNTSLGHQSLILPPPPPTPPRPSLQFPGQLLRNGLFPLRRN